MYNMMNLIKSLGYRKLCNFLVFHLLKVSKCMPYKLHRLLTVLQMLKFLFVLQTVALFKCQHD